MSKQHLLSYEEFRRAIRRGSEGKMDELIMRRCVRVEIPKNVSWQTAVRTFKLLIREERWKKIELEFVRRASTVYIYLYA